MRKNPYDSPLISLTADNQDIPQVQTISIVRLYLQQDGGVSHALQRLKYANQQATTRGIRIPRPASLQKAFNLPRITSTKKLLALGVHNTVEQHVAAHLVSQLERLWLTPTGRQIVERLGYPTQSTGHNHMMTLRHMSRDKIHVRLIPKSMHPTTEHEKPVPVLSKSNSKNAVHRRSQLPREASYGHQRY